MLSIIAMLIAIAIASNLDNAGVGIAYGIRKIHISHGANLLVALVSGVATLAAGILGTVMTRYVEPKIAIWIGAVVVIAVGIWVLTDPYRARLRQKRQEKQNVVRRILDDPSVADFDASQTISWTEALILGIALAMNALAGGFDAGVVHLSVWYAALAVAAGSFALLGISTYLGRKYASKKLGHKATYIAGILLILIGIHQLF